MKSARMMSRQTGLLIGLMIAALAISGCRESEQDRPLSFEPGVYQGKQDEKLNEQELDRLRQRGAMQQFI